MVRSCAWPPGKASARAWMNWRAERLIAPLGGLNRLAVQRLRSRCIRSASNGGAFERRIEHRHRLMSVSSACHVWPPRKTRRTTGGIWVLEQLIQRLRRAPAAPRAAAGFRENRGGGIENRRRRAQEMSGTATEMGVDAAGPRVTGARWAGHVEIVGNRVSWTIGEQRVWARSPPDAGCLRHRRHGRRRRRTEAAVR